ncbi:glycosyl hydrolase [Petroclostridium sp. X23]|uniref:glycosyl hydrolase n=1 Tax=Petroclostridium sp. X23 TaxID=3045146 RepID=UPI0024AD48D6|nr:glycosyl hydrolase [Petroclostridium sp. X23]WHH58622.1 glycosyl hydrolase [Petroclostridium sp. X23]
MFGTNLRQKFLANRVIFYGLYTIVLLYIGYLMGYHHHQADLPPPVNLTEDMNEDSDLAIKNVEDEQNNNVADSKEELDSSAQTMEGKENIQMISVEEKIDSGAQTVEGEENTQVTMVEEKVDAGAQMVESEKNIQMIGEEKKKEFSSVTHANTMKLMEYLEDIYGKKILSGQHLSEDFSEVEAIYQITGKKPALLGFDFMDYSVSRVERGAKGIDTEKAIQWWREGGIATFCWHWNAPMNLIDKGPDKQWYRGFYTEATTFNFAKGIENTESEEYRLMIRDIDVIAEELKKLQEEGVPVLWRPLHEASGGWFWWGSQGSEPYKKLWRIMFDRMTNYHHLSNLIWVWNGENQEWYPGDDVVDIVGIDFYGPQNDYSPRDEEFKTVEVYTDKHKMAALTETGVIPDPDSLLATGTKWLWYMTWCGEFVLTKDQKSYSDEYTQAWMLKKAYQHDYVITKDELPQFR